MSNRKIESLTFEQVAKFPEYVKRWTDIGLCTDPANRKDAEQAVREMYRIAGLKEPNMVWCDSPLSMGITIAILKKIPDMKIGEKVRDSVGDSVRASVCDSVWASVYGQHEAGWMAYTDYFLQECNLKTETEKMAGLWRLSKSCGWILPYQNICWLSERHNILHRNEAGRPHCESGPAIAYPDGWQLWYIDGLAVDEQIVMRPETQTIKQINEEQNADKKTIRISRFGWPRYIKETKAKCIDSRHNDLEGTEEALFILPDGETKLMATCPTGRPFVIGVGDKPKQIKTCDEAQKWIHRGRMMLART